MTSRERIRRSLEFFLPDRIGIYDSFCEETLELWHTQGLDKACDFQDYFDFDFRLFSSREDLEAGYEQAKSNNRFITISTLGPFEKVKQMIGFESALRAIHHEPKFIEKKVGESCDSIIEEYIYLKSENFLFDGLWLWEDIAYQKGLLFSLGSYKRILFGFHRKLCDFFQKEGMSVIFHSDGDVRAAIPLLIEAGVLAIHPLENSCGIDIRDLRREYKKDLVLFGNIDTRKLSHTKEAINKEIKDKFSVAKEGGYIYCCDSPIPKTVSLDNYTFTLETVKQIKL
jgi:uroporphyrinogen decarboxylase